MQLTHLLAPALLLVLPALVGAAPTSAAPGVEVESMLLNVRDGQTCNPPKPDPNDAAAVKKYNDLQAKMAAATTAAHNGQSSCPSSMTTQFNQSKDKTKRTQIKNTCVTGYQTCVKQRKAANKACEQMKGTVDQGHKTAVTVCQQNLDTWKAKKP